MNFHCPSESSDSKVHLELQGQVKRVVYGGTDLCWQKAKSQDGETKAKRRSPSLILIWKLQLQIVKVLFDISNALLRGNLIINWVSTSTQGWQR